MKKDRLRLTVTVSRYMSRRARKVMNASRLAAQLSQYNENSPFSAWFLLWREAERIDGLFLGNLYARQQFRGLSFAFRTAAAWLKSRPDGVNVKRFVEVEGGGK